MSPTSPLAIIVAPAIVIWCVGVCLVTLGHYTVNFFQEYYDETDLLRGKLDLLSNTSMVDFAMDVHKSLYPDQEIWCYMEYGLWMN